MNPSKRDYWDEFYTEGPGVKQYEWYDLQYEDVEVELKSLFGSHIPKHSAGEELLQIGVGNSLILEELLEDSKTIPLKITNIDISDESIEWMSRRQEEQSKVKRLTPQKFIQMDACDMTFPDASFAFVFDKGTLDALLSHGEDEYGDTKQIKTYFKEVWRVLRSNGLFLLISGNDSSLLDPYFYSLEWDFERIPLKRKQSRDRKEKKHSDFGDLPMNLWVLTKP